MSSIFECRVCRGHVDLNSCTQMHSKCQFTNRLLVRYVCSSCGVIFGPLDMIQKTFEELKQDYLRLYTVYRENDCTEAELRAFHNLNPKKGGLYLNYGAGRWSKSADTLRKEGYTIYTYDPCAEGEDHWSIKSLLDSPEYIFDGVYSNNVLEHLQYPILEFQLMRKLLNESGKMSHATPCYQYEYAETQYHLHFYTGVSVLRLCDMCDLGVAFQDKGRVSNGSIFNCLVFGKR